MTLSWVTWILLGPELGISTFFVFIPTNNILIFFSIARLWRKDFFWKHFSMKNKPGTHLQSGAAQQPVQPKDTQSLAPSQLSRVLYVIISTNFPVQERSSHESFSSPQITPQANNLQLYVQFFDKTIILNCRWEVETQSSVTVKRCSVSNIQNWDLFCASMLNLYSRPL